MNARLSRFRAVLFGTTIAIHIPFAAVVHDILARWGAGPVTAAVSTLAISGASAWAVRAGTARAIADTPRPWWRTWLFDLPYLWHWCACAFSFLSCLVYAAVSLPICAFYQTSKWPHEHLFTATYTAGLIVCGYGCTLRRWIVAERNITLHSPTLDPRLDGFVIAHLSDLHIGSFTPPWWAMRWIRRANRMNADIIAVTGDLVTSGTAFHADIANTLGALKANVGVIATMGNHDYFGDGEPLVSLLREKGITLLRNEGITIGKNGSGVYVAGIDDTWTKRANIDDALRERPTDTYCILLAHDPDVFDAAASQGVDLTLSGHTHGGQIALPLLARAVNLARLVHPYTRGLYTIGARTLYVHAGLGTTGPPIRLGVAPEIAKITLRSGRS